MVLKNLLTQLSELEKKYKESKQKLRVLFEITRLLSSHLQLHELLKGIVQLLTKEYKFDLCAIVLFDVDDHMKIKKCVCMGGNYYEKIKTLNDPYTKKCFETKRIVIVNDIEEETKKADGGKIVPVPENMKSFALTPIILEDSVIGILVTASKKKGYFHIRYSDAIYIIANEIGIAIKIAKLYEELNMSNLELERKVRERTAELERTHKRLLEIERHAAMGKIANRVAHDLRNSLTVIGGFAKRVYKKLPDNDPNKKYLEIIVKEVEILEKKVAKIIKLDIED